MSAAQDAAAATGAAGNDDELDDDEFTDSVSSEPGHAPGQGRRTGTVASRFCCWSPLDPSPPQANVSRPRRRPQDEAPPAENYMELEFETDDEARPPAHCGPPSLLVCACLAVPLCALFFASLPSSPSASVSVSVVSVSLRLRLSLSLSFSLPSCEIIRLCVAFPS